MINRRTKAAKLVFLASALFFTITCSPRFKQGEVTRFILISVDTLRPDYLGAYNSARSTSPNIDQFAKEGILCSDVVSQAPSTLLSHKSILYSVYPSIHKTSLKTLPKEKLVSPLETLQKHGFHTAAFTEGGQMSRRFGMNKGFQSYWEPDAKVPKNSKLNVMKPLVLNWLENNYKQKFVLLVHSYQVHCPYYPPAEYRVKYTSWYKGDIDPRSKCGSEYNESFMTSNDYRFLQDLYAAEVVYIDDFIGEIIRTLKDLQIYDKTMIVFFSDHGESLGERKYVGHNQLYDVQLRIPLIFRIPGMKPQKINEPLQSLDVMPTVFDVAGIPPPYQFQGMSILPILTGKHPVKSPYRISEKHRAYSVQRSQWRFNLIRSDPPAILLYNLQNDPFELKNVSADHAKIVTEYMQAYEAMQQDSRKLASEFDLHDATTPEMDPELKEDLKALGYIQ